MFEDLRAAFREALENFNKELHRDQVPETVDRLLRGMQKEIVEEKAAVAGLEQQLEKALADTQRERENALTTRRRERMARDIGDEETAEIAARHATKHENHQALLEKKAQALRDELEFRRGTIEEMTARFTDARSRRDSLGASAGRSGARRSLSEADDLFAELDRMAEKIQDERAQGEAAEIFDTLEDEPSQYHVSLEDEAPREQVDLDAALAELKRRMGKKK